MLYILYMTIQSIFDQDFHHFIWMILIQILYNPSFLRADRFEEGEGSAAAYLSRLHDTGDLATGDLVTSYIQLDDAPSIH